MARDEEFEKLLEEIIKEGRITSEQADEILDWWQRRPPMNNGTVAESNFKKVSEWMQQKPEGIQEVFPGIEHSHSGK